MKRQSFSQQMGFESPLGKESVFHVEHDDPIDSQYTEDYTFQIIYCNSGVDVFDKYNANKDLKGSKHIVIYYEKPDKNKSNLFGTACRVRMGNERRELMQKLKSNKVGVIVKGFPAEARSIAAWAKEIAIHSGNLIDAKILENAVKFEFFSKTEMNSFFQKLFGINNKLADWLADGVGEMEKWKFTEENYEFALYGEKLKPLLPLSIFKPADDYLYTGKKNEKKIVTSGLTQLVKLYDSLDTIVFAKAFALASATPGVADDIFIGFVWIVKEFLDRNLSPQIKELFSKVKSIVKSASDFITDLKKEIVEEIAIVNAFLCGLINGLISILQTVLGLVAFAVDNIPILELEKINPQSVNSFQEKLEFIEDLIDVVSDNFHKIYEGIKKVVKKLGSDLKKLITAIGSKLTNLSKYFWAFFVGAVVFELILDAIIAFFTGGTALAAKLAANITRLSKQVAKKGIQLAEKTAAKAAASSASVINSVKAFFTEFIEALKSGKFIEWIQEKLLSLFKATAQEAENLLKTIYSKFGTVEKLSKSKGGIEIFCIVNRRVHIPVDKVLKYARGKIDDVVNKKALIDEYEELIKKKKSNAKPFTKQEIERFEFLDKTTYNARRSLQNNAILEKAGIPNTDEWNKKIFDELAREANKKLPNNFLDKEGFKVPIEVIVQGNNGKVILDTRWEKIGYAKFWMNTIIVKPFK